MRLGIQILQCPISDSVWDAFENVVLLDIADKNTKAFKFSYCAVKVAEMLCSCFVSYIPPQNILLFFSKRIETSFSFLNRQLNVNFRINNNRQFDQEAGQGQNKDEDSDGAIIIVQCYWDNFFNNFSWKQENNKTCDSEGCQMTWRQFEQAKKPIYEVGCSHFLSYVQRRRMSRETRRFWWELAHAKTENRRRLYCLDRRSVSGAGQGNSEASAADKLTGSEARGQLIAKFTGRRRPFFADPVERLVSCFFRWVFTPSRNDEWLYSGDKDLALTRQQF